MSRMSASFNKLISKQKTSDTSWFSNIGNEQKTIHYLCIRFTVCLIIGFGWNSARSLRYIKIWYICIRCHFNLLCFDLATKMFLLNHTELYRQIYMDISITLKSIYYKIYFWRFIYLHHPWWEWSRFLCYIFNWIG